MAEGSAYADAYAWAKARDFRVVVKVDGLAGGKGVWVCLNEDEFRDGYFNVCALLEKGR